MEAVRPILRVGLTGGIASGKTTVAQAMAELGAFVLDADFIAHMVMRPGGSAHDAVVARFGREILDKDGKIIRPILAERVFHDAAARAALDAIVHPEVRREVSRRIDEYAPQGHASMAVLDAALLVESGYHEDFHRLIVVRCSEETQIRRILARDGLSAAEARTRIAAQAPLERKLALADYVIDTEQTLRETRRQVERTFALLLGDFEAEFGPPS